MNQTKNFYDEIYYFIKKFSNLLKNYIIYYINNKIHSNLIKSFYNLMNYYINDREFLYKNFIIYINYIKHIKNLIKKSKNSLLLFNIKYYSLNNMINNILNKILKIFNSYKLYYIIKKVLII